jgi:hypothetical protein
VSFDELLSSLQDPEWNAKFDADHRFMEEGVYIGLEDLNSGFDSEGIYHFSVNDFANVIDRCEYMGVGLNGIESFDISPWQTEGHVYALDCVFPAKDQNQYEWTRKYLKQFEGQADISFSATFNIPEEVLKSKGYTPRVNNEVVRSRTNRGNQ